MSLVRSVASLVILLTGFSSIASHAETAPPPLPACIRQPFVTVLHPFPPYPTASQRTGEQGKLVMLVTVQPDGTSSDVKVTASSGYDRLDRAAASYIKANWRWPSFDSACAVSVTRPLAFIWNLHGSGPIVSDPQLPEITMTAADYPPEALAARAQSSTLIQATMMPDGTLNGLMVAVSSGYPDLDAKALETAPGKMKNVSASGTVDGKPLPVPLFPTLVQLSVHWSLAPSVPGGSKN